MDPRRRALLEEVAYGDATNATVADRLRASEQLRDAEMTAQCPCATFGLNTMDDEALDATWDAYFSEDALAEIIEGRNPSMPNATRFLRRWAEARTREAMRDHRRFAAMFEDEIAARVEARAQELALTMYASSGLTEIREKLAEVPPPQSQQSGSIPKGLAADDLNRGWPPRGDDGLRRLGH